MTEYLLLFIPFAALLGYALKSYQAYRFQNAGEILVRTEILKNLPPSSWHLLNNITLKVDDGTTQVDHILVSRYGVFVIETKDYSGWLFGDEKSKQWTQVNYRLKNRFQNPLRQNFKHIKAVQALLDFLPPEQIKGLVVFTGSAIFKTNMPSGVYYLDSLLTYLKGLDQEILTENRLQFCVGRLECNRMALTEETDIEHQANLQSRWR